MQQNIATNGTFLNEHGKQFNVWLDYNPSNTCLVRLQSFKHLIDLNTISQTSVWLEYNSSNICLVILQSLKHLVWLEYNPSNICLVRIQSFKHLFG